MKIREYIQVKAAGGTPPNPAVFCPANGYVVNPYPPYEPPFVTVIPNAEQIILLCNDMGYGVISLLCSVNNGVTKVETLDENANVLATATFTTNLNYTFPTQETGTYYQLRLSPNTAGSHITMFHLNITAGYPNRDSNVFKAEFYTPVLTSLASAFIGNRHIREAIFNGTMNSLTTFSQAFSGSTIFQITWPTSLNGLTTMANMFVDTSDIVDINLSSLSLPALTTLQSFCYQSSVQNLSLPATLNAVTTMAYLAYKAMQLKSLVFSTSVTGLQILTSAFSYSILEELTFPEMAAVTNITDMCRYMPSVKKITMAGSMNNVVANATGAFGNTPNLKEITFPASMSACTVNSLCDLNTVIQKVAPPANITAFDPVSTSNIFNPSTVITNFTRETTNWPAGNYHMSCRSFKLKAFYFPTLKVRYIALGYSANLLAPLTVVDIDWANSGFSLAAAPQVILYAQLGTAELERIFGLLPVMVKTITCSSCPGYAAADKTIATAKGWTVN